MLKNIFIWLLALIAISCVQQVEKTSYNTTDSTSENTEIVNDSTTSEESEIIDAVGNQSKTLGHFPSFPLSSEPEVFRIDQKKETVLITSKGTEIYIPANCFTDNSGKVNISVIEAYSKKDMLKNGFQTVSDNKLLVSDGMIEIRAYAGIKTLEIAKGKKIRVELPKKPVSKESKVFLGSRIDNRVNWKETGEVSREMIPIPLEYLSPRHLGYKYYSKWLFAEIQNNKSIYQNTYMSTDQFMERFVAITSLRDSSIMTDAFNIYVTNLQKPLWKVDLEIYKFLNKLDSNEYTFLNEDLRVFYQFHSKKFLNFSKEGLSFVKQYLSKSDSLFIKRYIQLKGGNAKLENAFVNSYYISKLGSYNIDHYFEVEGIGGDRLKFFTDLNLKLMRSFIVLKKDYCLLEGYRLHEKEFRFSQEDKKAIILPVGEHATIVVIGLDEKEQFYIGHQELTIERNPIPFTISMKKVDGNDMNKVIEENIKI